MNEITNVISAFSADQVTKLTGLSMRQLSYWDKLGFFEPQYAADDRRSPYSRIYSFTDVVGLRTISILKNKYKCSLPHLQEVARKLAAYSKTPWADLILYVVKRKVQFNEPETGKTRGVLDGQYALLPIKSVLEDVRREAEALRHREAAQVGKVERHRYVSHHSDVIAGTRIKVTTIRRFIEAGYSTADILKEYPSLTEADIKAVKRHGTSGMAA